MVFIVHVVSKDSIIVGKAKIEAIYDWARLTSPTEDRSFIGVVGYYIYFIKGFATIPVLVTRLM